MTHRAYGVTLLAVLTCVLMLLPGELFAQQGRGKTLPGQGVNRWIWAGHLPAASLRGVVLVDSSEQGPGKFSSQGRLTYYLDTTFNAQTPAHNFRLFFGPPGYTSADVARPKTMDTVVVRGGLDTSVTPPVLAVYELNGKKWRDSTGAPAWGTWISRNRTDTVRITNGLDTMTTLRILPGSFGTGQMGGGMMWPDSILGYITEFSPESLFTPTSGRILTGIYITLLGPNGVSLMQRGVGGMAGRDSSGFGTITFTRPVYLQFHLVVDTTLGYSSNLRQFTINYLAGDSTWKPVTNAIVDSARNNITVIDSVLASYYIITAPVAVSVEQIPNGLPEAYALQQNYPNPFNPSTTIEFSLPKTSPVRLEIFDLLGRNVTTLVSGNLAAGTYRTQWNAVGMASGMYFYRLVTPGFTQTKSLMLLK